MLNLAVIFIIIFNINIISLFFYIIIFSPEKK